MRILILIVIVGLSVWGLREVDRRYGSLGAFFEQELGFIIPTAPDSVKPSVSFGSVDGYKSKAAKSGKDLDKLRESDRKELNQVLQGLED